MSPYGPKWKEERRLYHTFLGKDAVQAQYGRLIEDQVQKNILQVVRSGKAVSTEYKKCAPSLFGTVCRPLTHVL